MRLKFVVTSFKISEVRDHHRFSAAHTVLMISRHHIPIPKTVFKIAPSSASCTLVPTGNHTPDRLCHRLSGKGCFVSDESSEEETLDYTSVLLYS